MCFVDDDESANDDNESANDDDDINENLYFREDKISPRHMALLKLD